MSGEVPGPARLAPSRRPSHVMSSSKAPMAGRTATFIARQPTASCTVPAVVVVRVTVAPSRPSIAEPEQKSGKLDRRIAVLHSAAPMPPHRAPKAKALRRGLDIGRGA